VTSPGPKMPFSLERRVVRIFKRNRTTRRSSESAVVDAQVWEMGVLAISSWLNVKRGETPDFF